MPRDKDLKMDRALGSRIRQLRNERGLSQQALGEIIGVAFQQIQKYEKGTNTVPSHRISAFCKALGITPDELYQINVPHAQPLPSLSNYAVRMALKLDRLEPPQRRIVSTLVNSFLDLSGDEDDSE